MKAEELQNALSQISKLNLDMYRNICLNALLHKSGIQAINFQQKTPHIISILFVPPN